jgi:hypothetical protein
LADAPGTSCGQKLAPMLRERSRLKLLTLCLRQHSPKQSIMITGL